jgi:hypothetical protein
LLNNALVQTHWRRKPITAATWRNVVRARVKTLDWARVVADVRPFLEADDLAELLDAGTLVQLLRS